MLNAVLANATRCDTQNILVGRQKLGLKETKHTFPLLENIPPFLMLLKLACSL